VGSFVFSLDKVFLRAKLLLSPPFHPHSSGSDFFAQCQLGVLVTTVDDSAIPLFIEHGADLTIRNNKGQTVIDAAKAKGPQRQEVLRKAIENLSQR
jgi:hypothetical protein